jgi:Resolvase, N terminal domain
MQRWRHTSRDNRSDPDGGSARARSRRNEKAASAVAKCAPRRPAASKVQYEFFEIYRKTGGVARSPAITQNLAPTSATSAQLEALRDYAQRRGWAVVEEVSDVGSGAKTRPKRKVLLAAARARAIDVIAVAKLDRWGRSTQAIQDRLNACG